MTQPQCPLFWCLGSRFRLPQTKVQVLTDVHLKLHGILKRDFPNKKEVNKYEVLFEKGGRDAVQTEEQVFITEPFKNQEVRVNGCSVLMHLYIFFKD